MAVGQLKPALIPALRRDGAVTRRESSRVIAQFRRLNFADKIFMHDVKQTKIIFLFTKVRASASLERLEAVLLGGVHPGLNWRSLRQLKSWGKVFPEIGSEIGPFQTWEEV
jgi:hypothetical protein